MAPVKKRQDGQWRARYRDAAGREHAVHRARKVLDVHPRTLNRVFGDARAKVPGLPDGFRFQDLRHYFASLLIASGADVKVVQARLRHASAKTTLDVYGHLMPDREESTRNAVESIMAARIPADRVRTTEINS